MNDETGPPHPSLAEPATDGAGESIVVRIPGGFGAQKPGWFQRLSQGLGKSSSRLAEQVASVLTKKRLDQDDLDQLEEMLIEADIGSAAAGRITAAFGRARFEKEAWRRRSRRSLRRIRVCSSPLADPAPMWSCLWA